MNRAIIHSHESGYRLKRVVLVNRFEDIHVHTEEASHKCISQITCLEGNTENTHMEFRTYFPSLSYSILYDMATYIIQHLETEDKNVYIVG